MQARVKAGQVGFQEFSKAILSAGEAGGIFGGSMTILSQTIEGKINIIKDTLFFARGRIGDAISDITKKILDFGIVLVNSLVGTSTAVDRTIGAVKVLIGTFIAYKATLATSTALILANTTATTGMLAKDGLLSTLKQILTGQINRTTLALGLETNAKIAGGVAANTFTAAELRAAAAATVLQRSLGVLVVVLGAALLAYQYLGKQQDQMAVDVKERTAGLEKEKIQFNQLTKAVMDKNVSTKTELEMLARLKKEHPIILKGIDNLKDAEEALKKKNIESNSVMEYRRIKFEQLKAQFPEQLKGIDNLAEAERKLGIVISKTNADYAVRRQLIINEIKQQRNDKLITEQLEAVIELEETIKRVRKSGTNIVIGTSGKTLLHFDGRSERGS